MTWKYRTYSSHGGFNCQVMTTNICGRGNTREDAIEDARQRIVVFLGLERDEQTEWGEIQTL